MSLVDQFESVFRASVREAFIYERIQYAVILVVTDFEADVSEPFLSDIRSFLPEADGPAAVEWEVVYGKDFGTTKDLLYLVERRSPDLIVTWRNLKSRAWRFPHSLGEHLDVLLQKTTAPVLVVPHPEANYAKEGALKTARNVMAVTDQLPKDHKLVNHAARFTAEGGKLYLTHIEDQRVFDRYMEAISKIPTIDTEDANLRIRTQLLKDPKGYIASCRSELKKNELPFEVEEIVVFGNRMSVYQQHIEEHDIDLLVMNTKTEDHLAMHGMAYPLAVELRSIPLLML